MQTLDLLVAGAVEEGPRTSPPGAPALGACYIVDAAATGAWAGKSDCIVGWTSGGWRFIPPMDGLSLCVRASGTFATYRAGAWEMGAVRGSSLVIGDDQVVGFRQAAIASPAGGSTIDAEARSALGAILAALRTHGLIES